MVAGPLRVMLVEDNPGDARLLMETLADAEDLEFRVEHFATLHEALERLDQGQTDLLLLDLSLPDSRGLETVERAHARSPQVPIVVLTGLTDEAVADEAVRKGAQDYLVKGEADPRVLMRTMRYAVERVKAEKAREEHLARLKALIQISADILAERTIRGLLQKIADGARLLTDARISVAGHGHRDGTFAVEASSRAAGVPEWPTGETFPVETGGACLELVERGRSIRLTHAQLLQHPAWKGLSKGHAPLRGLAGAPLFGSEGRAIGLILVSDKGEGDFTAEDEALLVQLAALASLALQQIEARTEAERRAEELDTVFAAMTDSVMVLDNHGRVLRANPAAIEGFGFDPRGLPRDEVARRVALRDPEGRPLPPERIPSQRAQHGEQVAGVRLIFTGGRGREYVIEASAGPLWANGEVAGVVTVWHDTSERERTEREIRQLNESLEQRIAELRTANQEMEAFTYSVSHDLRSPLSSLSGFSHLLLEDHGAQLDEEAKRVLDVIITNAERMGRLIDDLLDFSRLGRREVHAAKVNMEALARSVVEELRAALDQRKVQFVVGALPPAQADETLTRQVLVNLLSNAVKFTQRQEAATIEIGGRREGADSVYYVRDNGVGFDMQYAAKLFHVFERLHAGEGFEGTGIGLAIVQRIVKRHGGRVWAEGKVGEGATFYFALPAA